MLQMVNMETFFLCRFELTLTLSTKQIISSLTIIYFKGHVWLVDPILNSTGKHYITTDKSMDTTASYYITLFYLLI